MVLSEKRSSRIAGPLMGTLGLLFTLTVAYGIENTTRDLGNLLPNAGQVVVDEKVQAIASQILKDALMSENASEGFAIVADPINGKILAIANEDREEKKKGFWSLAERIEPASVAKSLVVAEALEKGVTTPDDKQFCENGNYKFAGKVFHDWKGFNWLTTKETIAMSSDIGVLKVAEKLGRDEVYDLLGKFGIGPGGSAQNFPGARVGTLPPKKGPDSEFTIPFVTFGQGFRTTPLEIVQAYGAIVNGGKLLAPMGANAADSDRRVIRQVLSEENSAKMREILREVVLSGTGRRNAKSYLYTTAGKTATGFSPAEDWLENSRGTSPKANMASFIGFAPVSHPRVEVFVGIRDPKTSYEPGSGAHGAEHAAPVFRNIAEAVLQHMKVPPDIFAE
jgi:cell division protein FtsI (penicillin-binding protein 3)